MNVESILRPTGAGVVTMTIPSTDRPSPPVTVAPIRSRPRNSMSSRADAPDGDGVVLRARAEAVQLGDIRSRAPDRAPNPAEDGAVRA
jgi:hypothetical protein